MELTFRKIFITIALIACLSVVFQSSNKFNDIEKTDEVWPQSFSEPIKA